MADEQNAIDGYELIGCVASGTHSQIWEVGDAGGQHLAMKLLVPEAMEDKENVATLKHEAKVQKSLTHPNFIPLHKIVANKHHAYILMDYCRAPNLKTQLITDVMGLQTRAHKLIEGLCISLAYMHDKGWVHRDVKPENILFNKSGELKLIDFSLSTRFSSGLGKMFGGSPKIIQGTRTYIAPETILKKPASPQTDMYSLGVTIFEVLAGQRPFAAQSPDVLLNKHLKEAPPPPSRFNRNVTPEADQFILRMLAKKPEKRHSNMNELLAEFRSLKLFKADVAELKAAAEQKKKHIAETGGDLNKAWSLDSRTDDLRKKAGLSAPVKPPSKRKPAPQPQRAAAAQQAPQAGQYPGQPQPGQFPQYAPPGYFPPGMYPPPGQPYAPQQPYPQQPYPQQPYPPQPYPQQQYPPPPGYPQHAPGAPPAPQPPHEQQAAATPPAAGQPAAPAAPPQSQPPPQADRPQPSSGGDQISRDEAELRPQAPIPSERHASQKEDDRDLPLMEDLPDIL